MGTRAGVEAVDKVSIFLSHLSGTSEVRAVEQETWNLIYDLKDSIHSHNSEALQDGVRLHVPDLGMLLSVVVTHTHKHTQGFFEI